MEGFDRDVRSDAQDAQVLEDYSFELGIINKAI